MRLGLNCHVENPKNLLFRNQQKSIFGSPTFEKSIVDANCTFSDLCWCRITQKEPVEIDQDFEREIKCGVSKSGGLLRAILVGVIAGTVAVCFPNGLWALNETSSLSEGVPPPGLGGVLKGNGDEATGSVSNGNGT
eukprot:Trichotokara_eunicae@DN10823_c0_g1_i1.p1